MATATAKTNKVRVVYSEITLELTPREAQTLFIMTQYVGGSTDSRRVDSDAIQRALRNATHDLIKEVDYPIYQKFLTEHHSGITFKDHKDVK